MARAYDDFDAFDDGYRRPGPRNLKTALAGKAAQWATPWAGMGALFPIGAAAAWQWEGDPAISSALTLGTVTVSALAWKTTGARGIIERVHSTISYGGAVGWLTLVTITGLHEPQANALMIGGGLAAFCWNLRRSRAGRTDTGGDVWSRMIAPRAGLGGSRLEVTDATDDHARGKLELPRGEMTAREAAGRAEKVAQVMGLPPNGVRMSPDPGDAGKATVAFTRRDLLETPTPWVMPGEVGVSVDDAPVPVGVYEDGTPAMFDPLSGSSGDLTHLLIAGMTGSGKSYGARVLMAGLLLRRDVTVVAADIVKGRQTLGPLADAVDWFADTPEDAREMLAAVLRAVPARAQHLADQGYDKWQPGCGLQLLVVWLEEAPALISDDKAFADLTKQARSAGIMLVVSVQRATYSNLPTDARSMLGSVLCFGVKTSADASFALDELTDQGARPELWRDQHKGYAYLSAAGIDTERHAMPMRTYLIGEDDMQRVAAWDGRNPLDTVTKTAFGAAYADRDHRASATVPPGMPVVVVDQGEDVDVDQDDDAAADDAAIVALSERLQALPERLEAPSGGVVEFGARPKVSPAEAREIIRAAIDELADDGQTVFQPRELHAATVEAARSEAWLYGQLQALQEEGRIVRMGDGTYRIRELEPV